MRKFLPIKGPGGRYLTPKEKVALLVLGVTLVLCALTILAGEDAYAPAEARNPVFAVVALLCRTFGGGIVALYALILVWTGLLYFKGEKIAHISPLGGRFFAALAVTIGVSGALGVAQLHTAGDLGGLVGGAIHRTFGGGIGFPVLMLLMLLGLHLAGQGAWAAMREPMTAVAAPGRAPAGGFGVDAGGRRTTGYGPLLDDGDPSPDERSLAVTQAMEEIERSKGVTIIEFDPHERSSLGEEVAEAPPPPPESEEYEVRRGLSAVEDALAEPPAPASGDEEEALETPAYAAPEEDEAAASPGVAGDELADAPAEESEGSEVAEEDEYDTAEHGFVPVPPTDSEPVGREEPFSAEAPAVEAEEEESVSAGDAEESGEQADGYEEDDDPYATGGLLRRLRPATPPPSRRPEGEERPFTTFDWRGRPIS